MRIIPALLFAWVHSSRTIFFHANGSCVSPSDSFKKLSAEPKRIQSALTGNQYNVVNKK